MPESWLQPHSLVDYKNQPALVRLVDKKLEIKTAAGQTLKVRPKDVTPIHPGPIHDLAALQAPAGEMKTAWALLDGATTDLADLADLIYGEFTPATAWAAWDLVLDGLYFSGTPDEITAHPADAVAEEQSRRAAKAAEQQAWDDFVSRVSDGRYLPDDESYLQEVAEVALGIQERSRVMRALGHTESPQNAHALLLAIGYWTTADNPYPQREGVSTSPNDLPVPELPDEPRRDLTHLLALAIDDEGNQDPDDAISLEDGRLWVHVADVAALAPPDSPLDIEARARAANLYLPEETVPMLPAAATLALGLGLSEVSPALSVGMDLDPQGDITDIEVVPSWVKVTRLTYEEAETRLSEEPYQQLFALAQRYERQRRQNGAIHIELPEVKMWVEDGQVHVRPLPPLRSRTLVREAMLMTGEAVARFALRNDIPIPFSVQDPPDEDDYYPPPATTSGPAGMFAIRRMMKRSHQQTDPSPHAGLGMDLYAQSTSPLRRYLDLVCHQQIRAFLREEPQLDGRAIMERVAAVDGLSGAIRRTERLSLSHWAMVYLQQRPDWQGRGIVVDRRGSRVVVLIPELALETQIYPRHEVALNSTVTLSLSEVNLPELEAHFQIVS